MKRAFHAKDTWTPLTKKPLVATDEEGAANPALAQREAPRGAPRLRGRRPKRGKYG